MKTVKRHLTTNISGILKQPDSVLGKLFDMDGREAREELEKLKAQGHIYIGSDTCEGFDPVTGCPGHEVKEA